MYYLLNKLQYSETPRVKAPGTDFLKRGYLQNIETIRAGINGRRGWASNDHIVTRLITGLPVDLNIPVQRFYDICTSINNQQVVKHQLCNSVNPGVMRVGNGSFYDKLISEVYIAVEENINVALATKEWYRLEPIKVLYHPYDDLSMALPNGNYPYKVSNDVAIFVINLPLLFLMYREWYHNVGKGETKDITLRAHSFVQNYLLPTIVPSHTEIARFNRLCKKMLNKPLTPFRQAYSFFINDYSQQVDSDINFYIDFFKKTPLTYNQSLSIIPSITRDNFSSVLRIPDVLINRQNKIPIFLTRLKVIHFLMTVNPGNHGQLNLDYKNEVAIVLRELENDSLILSNYPLPIIEMYEDLRKLLL